MSILENIIRVIAPHSCLGCAKEGALLCDACCTALPSIPPRCYRCTRSNGNCRTCSSCRTQSQLEYVWVATPYQAVAKELVHALKFERAQAAALDIAQAVTAALPMHVEWLITHVPTASSRVRSRGYDQAQLIAREVARRLSCPYLPLLARLGQQRQVGTGRLQRQHQLATQFRVLQPHMPQTKPVLLIDDVLTTGATLEACAAALHASGITKVSAAAFAAA